jgi:FKBP-type peptidyl-prolyl cis-trans isomerase
MKKLSIVFLAALAMVACGNSYKAQNVTLSNPTDSINYVVGFITGSNVKANLFAEDSTDASIAVYIDALEEAYLSEEEEQNEIVKSGRQLGLAVRSFEEKGAGGNSAWTLNEELLFQGLVNGLFGDTAVMKADSGYMFLMQSYEKDNTPDEKAKLITSKCPKEAKSAKLESHLDSVNYALGLIQGSQLRISFMANQEGEAFEDMVEEFIENINSVMSGDLRKLQLKDNASFIGTSIRQQEPVGLLGMSGVETNFELIKQGIINGLYNYQEIIDIDVAKDYLNATRKKAMEEERRAAQEKAEVENAAVKEEGEKFLAENATKPGVKVTPSGLQYKVIEQGKGPKPNATQTVEVHYEGTLIDGTVFDSSYERGESISFPLNGVIKGWTEGLQLMPVGSTYMLYIPYDLAYGERGAGASIPPYAALIFKVQLLGIK